MTPESRAALAAQLQQLTDVERPHLLAVMGQSDGRDAADAAERSARELDLAQLDTRIARLRDRLDAPEATGAASGLVEPGALLVLDFGDGPETYRFADFDVDGTSVVTPASPLGQALAGARGGDTVHYRTPRGEASVDLVSIAA